ncbi:hypothetical protein DFS34DRAFT_611576 [Phlyctochytrium arcticum]|nr:hypothetical protein DFS34DRAFT_611576 [Phlyctochytrium arcticum]
MISGHEVDESPIKEKWRYAQGVEFATTDSLNHSSNAEMPHPAKSDRSTMVSPGPANSGTSGADSQSGAEHQQPSYHDVICSHLYHNGYLQGLYADLIVRLQTLHPNGVSNGSPLDAILFKLHRIIAIRSPYLASLLREDMEINGEYQPVVSLTIPAHDPNLTPEGLSIAFGHLYASYPHSLLSPTDGPSAQRSALLRSVLCAANLLQLGDLATLAGDQIKGDINRESVLDYCQFVSQADFGASYGSLSQEIRSAVLIYLTKGVVGDVADHLGPIWGNREGEAYRELVKTFAELPFEWLKKVVESKSFEVPGDMERFSFAKEIIALRQRNKNLTSSLIAGEENVLLAFGSKDCSGVTLVRKAIRHHNQHHHHHQPQSPSQSQQSGSSTTSTTSGGLPRMGSGYGGPERRLWKAGH